MNVVLVTPPVLEPVTLAELKLHCKIDSGSFADSIDETQSIAPGLKTPATYTGTPVEVLGYTAIVEFACGAIIAGGTLDIKIQDCDTLSGTYADWGTAFTQVTTDGMLTSAVLAMGTTPAYVANGIFTYFIAGIGYSKPANAAGTSPGDGDADDVIPVGKYGAVAFDIGDNNVIDVVEATDNITGYLTAASAILGLPAVAASHVRMGTVTAMKSDGAFTFGITALDATNSTVAYTQATLKANYNSNYEKAYTGTKRYINIVAVVSTQDCSFGTSVIRLAATSIEDDLLTELIKTARMDVENDSRRQIITATWDYYLQEWPDGDRIKIPLGNLQTVTHIKYKESDWASVADDKTFTDYLTEMNGDQCGFIVLPYAGSWPSVTLYPSNPITIRFVCGWTTAALVPSTVKSAIKIRCAKLYKSRGEDVVGQTVHEDKTYDRLINNIPRLYDEF